MNVEILVDGPYAKFNVGGKQTAQQLKAGDVVTFPDEYALDLIASKLAKATVKVVEAAAREVIFQEDPDSDLSLPEQARVTNAERHQQGVKGRKRG